MNRTISKTFGIKRIALGRGRKTTLRNLTHSGKQARLHVQDHLYKGNLKSVGTAKTGKAAEGSDRRNSEFGHRKIFKLWSVNGRQDKSSMAEGQLI